MYDPGGSHWVCLNRLGCVPAVARESMGALAQGDELLGKLGERYTSNPEPWPHKPTPDHARSTLNARSTPQLRQITRRCFNSVEMRVRGEN